MSWQSEYEEICQVIDNAPESRLKRERLKKAIKKDLQKIGTVDYNLFPIPFRWNLCAARLRMGKFNNYDGWEYRSDWSMTFQGYNGYQNPLPKWDGRPVKKLLILGEQGIGDEILFSSVIPELIVRLGHDALTFYTYPRLQTVMERSFKIKCELRKTLSEYTDGDAVVALGDLMMFYRRDKSHFPGKPFLKPDPEKVKRWKDFLGPGYHVGYAWKARHGCLDKEEIALPGYWNLQYDDEGPDSPPFDVKNDFENLFAFVAALDRVVTVTQTLVHVAGSVGTPCDAIRPPKGTGEVRNQLWYYGMGGPMTTYGSVHVHNSIQEFRSRRRS